MRRPFLSLPEDEIAIIQLRIEEKSLAGSVSDSDSIRRRLRRWACWCCLIFHLVMSGSAMLAQRYAARCHLEASSLTPPSIARRAPRREEKAGRDARPQEGTGCDVCEWERASEPPTQVASEIMAKIEGEL